MVDKPTSTDAIAWFQTWFTEQCDDEWEHGQGIHIATLDNPGWSVDISLQGTSLDGALFTKVDERFRSGDDWIWCDVEEGIFKARGGPKNLGEILDVFREWADNLGS